MVVIKNKLSVLVLYCTGYVELAQWIEGWPKKRAFPWLMAKTFVRPRTSGEMDGTFHKSVAFLPKKLIKTSIAIVCPMRG